MALLPQQNGKAHVLEIANRATVQKLGAETVSAITSRLDNHESGLNANAHGISNIAGLQTALNGKANTAHTHVESDITDLDKYSQAQINALLADKQDTISGATGTLEVITAVDFVEQTVTTATITVSNGIITSIV